MISRIGAVLLDGIIIFLVTAVLFEGALRLQQVLGPFEDLEMRDASFDRLSDVVNHRPLPGDHIFFKLQNRPIHRAYDELGLRVYKSNASFRHCDAPSRVLFLGDSFIEGYDEGNTIPYRVANLLAAAGKCITPLNAGQSSYSPAIFVPQFRTLFPQLRPDYVVVSIDETDLYDDSVRYRSLVRRDASGRNVGVSMTPRNYEYTRALIEARSEPLYVMRLLRKTYHNQMRKPWKVTSYKGMTIEDSLDFSRLQRPDARELLADELAFFKSNISELLDVINELGPGLAKTAFIRHPHLGHLQPDRQGQVWNTLVRDAVAEVLAKRGVRFYDAQDDLKRQFGNAPEKLYWKGDMHFNFEGIKEYASLVATFLDQSLLPGAQ